MIVFLKCFPASVCCLLPLFAFVSWASAAERPNILVLMADDWSWPHAQALGDKTVKTPTFDKLVREGVLFERAFVSSPSCTPSRMAIATGQWHWRLGEAQNLGGSLAKDIPTYADLLAKAGYHTGFSRKGASPSKHTYRGTDPFGPRFKNFEVFLSERKKGAPFCFWYGSGAPHRPYVLNSGKAAGLQPEEVELPPGLPDHPTVRNDLLDYYAAIQLFDREASVIIDQLDKEGELNNTLIVMSGDNGMPFPRAKATLYDTGTHVPLVVRWGKQVKAERKVSDFVSLCDLGPTFLEAAGIEPPKTMTGRSLFPQLKSKHSGWIDPDRDHVLTGMSRHCFPYPRQALRTERFLYVRNKNPENWMTGRRKGPPQTFDFSKRHWPKGAEAFCFNVDPSPTKQYMLSHPNDPSVKASWPQAFGPYPPEELYDLQKDPGQISNLAHDSKSAEDLQIMRKWLDKSWSVSTSF
ncbi:MAG: sulfatase [Opitutae bacterium]|nr:sulfatase [Opitutae bacterium]